MEYVVLGWPEDGPQLRLDHREFSYAGKFVMSNTGKAVAREEATGDDGERAVGDGSATDGEHAPDESFEEHARIVAAIAFNEDRTDPTAAWLRYVTVRRNRRGEGVGSRLARFAAAELQSRGYDRIRIAVNNSFAYHALYKAGFGYTGERTGLAELILVRSAEHAPEPYQSGLDVYRERENLAPEERAFLAAKADDGPPDVIAVPD